MYTKYQRIRTRKKRSEVVEFEISCAQASFSPAPACSRDTFVIAKASTQKAELAVVAQVFFASSFSVISSGRCYGAWPSSCGDVVRASRFRSAKIKTARIQHLIQFYSFWRSVWVMCNVIPAFFQSTTVHSSGISAYYDRLFKVCFFQQFAMGMTIIMKMTFVSTTESKCSYQ